MKIVIVANKTLPSKNGRFIDPISYDYVYKNFIKLGHETIFYDTIEKQSQALIDLVKEEKPDLLFCCMTGDPRLTPYEPWDDIKYITKNNLTKTFNWFCDDAWRFNNFSSKVCWFFHFCSTPEEYCVEKYKKIGYKNVISGFWHADSELFEQNVEKDIDVSFCGQLHSDRHKIISYLRNQGINVQHFSGITTDEMKNVILRSKIGINFSKNFNARPPVLQVKGRMAEVIAGKTLLVTEYAPGLERHFKIDNEIICFKSPDEAFKKITFLLKNENVMNKIADNGYKRFLKDHDTRVRLKQILDFVNEKSLC